MQKILLLVLSILMLNDLCNARPRSLFEPPEDKQLLIIGQDLGAVGGFARPNNDGYADHIAIPLTGVTTYTSLPWLTGLKSKINLGTGDLHAQAIIDNSKFENAVLAIGLHMVDQEKKIAEGKMDSQIKVLGNWIKASKRPVFLRIGYEFDGSWNHYEPENYKLAFRRIVDTFKTLKVENCAMVWQAATSPYNGKKDLKAWYPGDEYVDWVGYSWFLNSPAQIELTDELLNFAKAHGKPVMTCESAPQGYDLAKLTRRNISAGPDGAAGQGAQSKTPQQIWDEWYVPFFDYIGKHRDTIKIVAYINVNWDAQRVWGAPYSQGYWGDSRVEANPVIKQKWSELIASENWLRASPDLFEQLGMP